MFSTAGFLPGLCTSSVLFFIWAKVSLGPGAELLAFGFPVLYGGMAMALSWRSPTANWAGAVGMFGGILIGFIAHFHKTPDVGGLPLLFVMLGIPILFGIHVGKFRSPPRAREAR